MARPMNPDAPPPASLTIRIPADWEPHACCWMSWAVHPEWKDWVDVIKSELAMVIRAVAQFERVCLFTAPDQKADAKARFGGGNIEIIEAQVDDIWMRDIAPTFALRGSEVIAIDWNFDAWNKGEKRPARAGDRLAQSSHEVFGVARLCAPFVAEGGAIITDGRGTLITTRSCLINSRRNRTRCGENQQQLIERGLKTFGVRKVIWLEGDSSEPVTSGHVDGFAMFAAPATVLVDVMDDLDIEVPTWRENDIATLEQSRDAQGQTVQVVRVSGPRQRHWKFRGALWAPCYLNAYVSNGAVVTAKFGDDERDEAARKALAEAFPGRAVVMLRIDHICNGGGGIRCLTQPMPLSSSAQDFGSTSGRSSRCLQSQHDAA